MSSLEQFQTPHEEDQLERFHMLEEGLRFCINGLHMYIKLLDEQSSSSLLILHPLQHPAHSSIQRALPAAAAAEATEGEREENPVELTFVEYDQAEQHPSAVISPQAPSLLPSLHFSVFWGQRVGLVEPN